ncbi:Uncharacterised protein [Amycolatopsis camponoti]|uniref:Uncharacterized protein n=1 Tax=Amycolatopsis camponoti TaxID=2606593 RepID=A0A6I8M058_9PSEU|nr:hypothetical protein [Amycolatopsis camponoti]VVJ22768.1 Uncharacterised protein [Amycolatopsis camponoti]
MSVQPPSHDPWLVVWLALSAVVALLIGTGTGVLGWLSGQGAAAAVITGGIGFGGTMGLALAVIGLTRRR